MEKSVRRINSPEELNNNWDNLADVYYLTKEFLIHLHRYNYCSQKYYELYSNGELVAGTIVYTVKTNILTFLNIPGKIKFQVIGLPVSIASPPFVGDPAELEYLLSQILKSERGIILGLNFKEDYLQDIVLNLRTLPTLLMKLRCGSMKEYENSLRHPYRRRLHRIREKLANVTSVSSPCSEFNGEHHNLYLQVMKKTTTKLEILKADVFHYLPSNFELTTYYVSGKMLFWHILCRDKLILYYFMCGINYANHERYRLYQNSLLDIVSAAIKNEYLTIDLGQTAEIAKMRLGGVPEERRMFIYHRNPLIFGMLRLFGRFLAYSTTNGQLNVYKSENQ